MEGRVVSILDFADNGLNFENTECFDGMLIEKVVNGFWIFNRFAVVG